MDAPRLAENVNGNLVEKSSVSSKLIGIFSNGLPHVLIHFENYIIIIIIIITLKLVLHLKLFIKYIEILHLRSL